MTRKRPYIIVMAVAIVIVAAAITWLAVAGNSGCPVSVRSAGLTCVDG